MNLSPEMSDFRDLASTSGRRGSKKVRSGCITCKIRKVKCDEAKPSCLRCIRTGRRCDGYLDAATLSLRRRRRSYVRTDSHQASPFPSTLADLIPGTSPEERRSFDFYHQVVAPSLAGDLDAVFWRVLVPQICHTDLSVRHAVLAISSLYEALLRPAATATPVSNDPCHEFALAQYSTAIAAYLPGDAESPVHEIAPAAVQILPIHSQSHLKRPTGPLMAHVLFVCIDVLQGNNKTALAHFENGCHMLSQLGSFVNNNTQEPELALVKQHLVPLYTRLSMTSFLFGGRPLPIPSSLKPPTQFAAPTDSIHTLRSVFHDFVNAVLRFSQQARPVKYEAQSSDLTDEPSCMQYLPSASIKLRANLEAEKLDLEKQLARLRVSLSLFRVNQTASASPKPPLQPLAATLALLQIHLSVSEIWLATALAKAETAFDEHLTTFASVVSLAASVLDAEQNRQAASTSSKHKSPSKDPQGQSMPKLSVFTLETHIIPALYFVATKCRHSPVRHAALDLLARQNGRRENLWQADVLAAIASRVIKMEENTTLPMNLDGTPELGTRTSPPPATTSSASLEDDLYTWAAEFCNFKCFSPTPADDQRSRNGMPVEQQRHEQGDKLLGSPVVSEMDSILDANAGLSRQNDYLSPLLQHASAIRSTEPPFGVPEKARVHATAIRPVDTGGTWMMVFRKLQGLEGSWDVQTEFVGVTRSPSTV